jgi:hypothetical protein
MFLGVSCRSTYEDEAFETMTRWEDRSMYDDGDVRLRKGATRGPLG